MVTTISLLITLLLSIGTEAASGSGRTTSYWDCCKPSCSWPDKASVDNPTRQCDGNNNPLNNPLAQSGCDQGGTSFTCANMSPWVIDDNLAYGFAATKIAGGTESSWCCACYKLQFTSGPVAGKIMIVQTTNTGDDLHANHFDILIPGGGVGVFEDGCTNQYGQPLPGRTMGGVSSRRECDDANMPQALRAGCQWRFDWFKGADNPNVNFSQVKCPAALIERSGCTRADDLSFPDV